MHGNMYHSHNNHYSEATKHQSLNEPTFRPDSVHASMYDLNFVVDIRPSMRRKPSSSGCHSYGTRTHLEYLSPCGAQTQLGVHLTPHVRHGWDSNLIEAQIISATSPFTTLHKPLKRYHYSNTRSGFINNRTFEAKLLTKQDFWNKGSSANMKLILMLFH